MKRLFILFATISLFGTTTARAATAAEAKASKGPVQITLRLCKTKVKAEKSLWYKLELKNVGKKNLRVDDWIFKDPWAMYANSKSHFGIYLEIIGPDGKAQTVRSGGGRITYAWEPKPGELLHYTPEEKKEIAALESDWKRRGLTEQQQHIALSAWNGELNDKKNRAELADPTKQLWLTPGASTSTFAWMDRGPDEYAGRSEDDAYLRLGYTQLWSFTFYDPGTYRIRAVYDYSPSERYLKTHKLSPDDERIKFKTPFIEFLVAP